MRTFIDLVESVGHTPFDAKKVFSDLCNEMRQGVIARTEDAIEEYNDAIIDGPEIDMSNERPWRVPAFKAWLLEKIERTYSELHSNTPVRAWRAIMARPEWTPDNMSADYDHIGRHWTYTRNKATAYDGDPSPGHVQFVIEAMIPPSSVDWEETVLHHMTRDRDEDEITLHHGAPVVVVGFERQKL